MYFTEIGEPTEIYLNEDKFYPNGYKVTIHKELPNIDARYTLDETEPNKIKLLFSALGEQSQSGIARVVLTPKFKQSSGYHKSLYAKMFYKIINQPGN